MWYRAGADLVVVVHLLFIGFIVGGVETAIIRRGDVSPITEIISHHTEFLKHVAADVDPLMTAYAAIGFKKLIAVFFFFRQCILVAA